MDCTPLPANGRARRSTPAARLRRTRASPAPRPARTASPERGSEPGLHGDAHPLALVGVAEQGAVVRGGETRLVERGGLGGRLLARPAPWRDHLAVTGVAQADVRGRGDAAGGHLGAG